MNIEPPAIPYNFADLEPAMSRDTLVFHFSRHQRVCFDRMLAMVRGSELEALPLDELIRVTERNPSHAKSRRPPTLNLAAAGCGWCGGPMRSRSS
jgi:superoxide dismutase